MVMEEVDGTDALSYEKIHGYLNNNGFTPEAASRFMGEMDAWSQTVYKYKHSLSEGSYNWPYDYFSLVELGKLNTKFVFRPELKQEFREVTGGDRPPIDGPGPGSGIQSPLPVGVDLGNLTPAVPGLGIGPDFDLGD
jgi:hypothetical protein